MRCLAPVLIAASFCASLHAQPEPQPERSSGWQHKEAVYAKRYMVVAAHPLAVDAGIQMLRRGGSAVDAAIATQLVLNLVEPQSSGIGGGAFLLHWSVRDARVAAYDGRESAPLAARSDRFLDAAGRPIAFREAAASGRSVGVPGVLRMLELAHRRHGKLPWRALFAPAIRAAEKGFALSPRLFVLLSASRKLREDPAARALYFGAAGEPLPIGTRLVNAEFAASLRAIAEQGADAFYFGAIAEDIVAAVRAHRRAGDLSLVDLARYRAEAREAVCAPHRTGRGVYSVCGMPPPSSGGIGVLQILGVLEQLGFQRLPANSLDALHLFAEAGRLAYADRSRYIADPDFVSQPVEGLLDSGYLAERAKLIGERSMRRAEPGMPRAAPVLSSAPEAPGHGTTHLVAVDARGNAVSMTSSIENAFGSGILVRGFFLNNQLTDFSFLPEVGGVPVANRVEPGKRPRSAMSPTLVFDPAGRLHIALGSPGGASIINLVAKTLVATLDWGLDIQAAIAAPNFGSRNGPTEIESGSAYEAHAVGLRERGHDIRFVEQPSGVHGIERAAGLWRGGADPRREGVARGR